ncbi:FMN-binding negative transcriptional regulator [Phytohalomonas tamaricis]|uniref:FMN-binding negative transcriptional regulator n=1 Tax=Phytohalomonas tamaricis TaxID=2081032 RepID=UPI000D0B36B2|nr:FMN-binding negative transcriptional regulator [Phytohalomonas tamaricis]
MYCPTPFIEKNADTLQGWIDNYPFASLVSHYADGLTADHLPLMFDPNEGEHGVLRGHIARANPLWKNLSTGVSVMALFHGPQAYVTPSWYPAKREHGRVVPTWNYMVVHVHGRLRFIDDPAWLRRRLAELSDRFEKPRQKPWHLDDAPENFIEGMCRAVIGVEIKITRLEGKRKASQHKPEDERREIHAGLRDYGYNSEDATLLSSYQAD